MTHKTNGWPFSKVTTFNEHDEKTRTIFGDVHRVHIVTKNDPSSPLIKTSKTEEIDKTLIFMILKTKLVKVAQNEKLSMKMKIMIQLPSCLAWVSNRGPLNQKRGAQAIRPLISNATIGK